jgi:predicted Zn-ribbon and HTH transcriptional regulator
MMNESQRGMVAASIAKMPNGGNRNKQQGANLHGANEAAQMLNNLSPVTCKQCGNLFGVDTRLGISAVAACGQCEHRRVKL